MSRSAAEVKLGLKLVIGALGLVVLLELLSDLVALGLGQASSIHFLRLLIILGLCWPVYTGNLPARMLLTLMLAVNSIMLLALGSMNGDFLSGLVGFLDIPCALVWWLVPAVGRYYDYLGNQL